MTSSDIAEERRTPPSYSIDSEFAAIVMDEGVDALSASDFPFTSPTTSAGALSQQVSGHPVPPPPLAPVIATAPLNPPQIEIDTRRRKPSSVELMDVLPQNLDTEKRDVYGFDKTVLPTKDFRRAAREISERFGLSLFGFDVIIPIQNNSSSVPEEQEGGAKLVVIDVNFFPSYKEVPDFPRRLRSLLRLRSLALKNTA